VAQIATRMRRSFVERMLQVRWSYLVDQPMGEITNALGNDATRAGQAYLSAATFLVYAFQALIYVTVAMFVSWQITSLSLIAGAGIAVLMGHFIRRARKAGRQQTEHTSTFVRDLSDTLNNIKPLKAMDRQRNVALLLGRSIDRLRKALRRQVVAKQALKTGNESLAAIVMGLGLAAAIGVWQVPGPELVVLAVLLVQLVGAINKIQGEYQKAVIFESAYDSVIDKIADLTAKREADLGTADPVFETACRLEDVAFAHPSRPVLNGLTLDFPKNSTTVLTGPSGAGKTTVADLILGFIAPDRGQVLIDGRPLAELSLGAWRRKVGYVPQELILFNETIHDNITLGDPDLDAADVRDALRVAGGLDFVETLPDGLRTPVGEKGARLSGGQRQRIALARALVERPALLILDEVTSALDPATEAAIIENIRSLQGSTTIIAITHRSALLDLADRVYALQDGRLAPSPTVAETARDVV
ncbi:MAG: ABC transporter ATP-binding protein, partial [Pseudomonadota bacterium]